MPLAALTWQRQSVFASPLNLWRDTLAKSPFSDTAANNLGYALFTAGEYQKSLDAFERALQLTKGTKADARAGAAMALERLGRPALAEEALRQAIALNPLFANPPKLVEALLSNEEHAAVLQQINDRLTPPRP
jgi:Flp pilus assembly protein TadD